MAVKPMRDKMTDRAHVVVCHVVEAFSGSICGPIEV
jgi:hypothetical protein